MKMRFSPARLAPLAVVAAALGCFGAVFGGAFVPLKEVAPVADLEHEAHAQLAILTPLLKDKASYEDEENRKKKIPRAAGLLAVMGQAIAEHPDKAKVKVSGPALRDAARRVIASKTLEEAVAALGDIKPALEGKSGGKAETDHGWNKLMSLHRLMEEVEDRHEQLRDVSASLAKGEKGKPDDDARHASTLAVLSLVMYADTHEVKNNAEIPLWQEFSKEFRKTSSDLSVAIHKGDAASVKALYPKTTQLCGSCHDKFRK
jgi:hypothetical protein